MFKLHHVASIDSTNKEARSRYSQGELKPFDILYADLQTAGRGQKGNGWESEKGANILATFVVCSPLKAIEQFQLNQVFSLGVVRFLERFLPSDRIHIKWPNDIYVDLKKIAGILIEHEIMGSNISASFIGIGLNINQSEFSSLLPNPTSLILENNQEFDVKQCLVQLAEDFEYYYDQLKSEDVHRKYLSKLLFFNELREYKHLDNPIKARICGISDFGFLQLQTENGALIECDLKEINYLL